MDTSVGKCDFTKAPQWRAVYKQPKTGAGLGVYVDDFELVASAEDTPKIWKQLEKHIEFGGEHVVWNDTPTKHLGCEYRVEQLVTKKGDKETTIKRSR